MLRQFKWIVALVLVCPWWAASQSEISRITLLGKKTGGGFSKVRTECRRGDAISCHEYGQYLRERNQKIEAAAAYGRACNELSQQVMASCAAAGTLIVQLYHDARRKKLDDDAQTWFRKGRTYLTLACDKDVLASCHNLGVLLYSTPDLKKHALRFFKRACIEVLASCKVLARAAIVAKDFQKGYDLYLKGCDKFDDPSSCHHAGVVADRNLGDHDLAMKLYGRACDFGYALACMDIARAHENKGELDEAVAVLEPLCHQDFDMSACSKLAKLEEKLGHLSRAIAAYREVCDQARGGAWACYDMAILEEKRGRTSKAKKAFAKACLSSAHSGLSKKACTKACNTYKDQASCKRLKQ